MKCFNFPAVAAVIIMVATGCARVGAPDNGDGPTPIVLSAKNIEAAASTRVTSDGKWVGGEQVRVRLQADPVPEIIHTFTAGGDGQSEKTTLTPSLSPHMIYWQDLGVSRLTASAWRPAGYSFQPDQSGGIQEADFIFAQPVTGITPGNYSAPAKELDFHHMTAKVVVNIVRGDNYTTEGSSLKVFGYSSVSAIDTVSGSTGDAGIAAGVISGSDDAWLIPYFNGGVESAEGKVTDVYTILLLPREYAAGESFLDITLGGNMYEYRVPSDGSLNIEAGMRYDFTVTVSKTSADVSAGISDWESGDMELDPEGLLARPEGYMVGDCYPYPEHPDLSKGIVVWLDRNEDGSVDPQHGVILGFREFGLSRLPDLDYDLVNDDYWDGLNATARLTETSEAEAAGKGIGLSVFSPPLNWIKQLNEAGTGGITWYLPASYELVYVLDPNNGMLDNYYGTEHIPGDGAGLGIYDINNLLWVAGGDALHVTEDDTFGYWTATYRSHPHTVIYFLDAGRAVEGGPASTNNYARAFGKF
ncbi:MAG: fimbrillin family protein [Tannerellaceae bacterium]|nr:fimbrillin family protein [Tannerellaceae bacterium]